MSGHYDFDEEGNMEWVEDPSPYETVAGGSNSSFFDEDPNDNFAGSMKTTYNPDGSKTYQDPDGTVYTVNADGSYKTGSGATETTFNPKTGAFTGTPNKSISQFLNDKLGVNFDPSQWKRLGALGVGGIAGLTKLNNPAITKVGYQGGLPNLEAQRTMLTAPVAGLRPGAGGTNYGGEVQYSNPADNKPPPPDPVQYPIHIQAAHGGLIGMAHGGRYLQGNTDGMADKLSTSIDGKHAAALSHGEFVIPADVVSHLGNGNSDAGAQKLYQMMDKIRQARTGNKKQGKQINPDKFMPGGLASAYAAGGSVRHFETGGTTNIPVGTTGVEQTVAGYTGNYIPNMLAKTQALTSTNMPQYTGTLSADASNLQNTAFTNANNLSVPGSVGTAAATAGDISKKAQGINYSPSAFTNQFSAPTASTATNFTNQYQAPTPYQNTNFTSGIFNNEQAQQYMNPYLQQSLNPQLDEMRRQSQINQQTNNANAIKSGSFGGGAGDIMNRAAQRDLSSGLANLTGQGYNTAYTNAMGQFNADQARALQAQQASEQSKQFGASQGMTAAQMMAQYGMSAQQAQEAARQFQQNQAMTGAQNTAQFGQTAQAANEQSRQFGANLGLQGLNTGLQAAQAQGNMGIAGANLGLQQLQEQAQLGAQQRGITSEGIAADKKAFEEARNAPYDQLKFQSQMLNGLPITATNYTQQGPSELSKVAQGMSTVDKALETLGLNPPKPKNDKDK